MVLCSQPILNMHPSFPQQNPQLMHRSKLFSLATTTYFACNLTYTQTNAWSLTRLDGSSPQSVDLRSNPTWQTSELVIQSNILDYGIYEFTFQVYISGLTLPSTAINISTFVQIIPTGISVYATKSGVSSVLIGSQQSFVSDPSAYSHDLDSLVQPNSLSYKFYCRTINLNESSQANFQMDLLEYKTNLALQLMSNQTCFSSTSSKPTYIFI